MLDYRTTSLGETDGHCVAAGDAVFGMAPEHIGPELLTFDDVGMLPYVLREQRTTKPLLHALDIDVRQARLAAVASDPVTYAAECEQQCAEVAGLVHGALVFYEGSNGRNGNIPPAVEDVSPTNNRADCYGHTVATSLALEQIGIQHSIVYVAGHAAIGLFNSNDQMYFADPSNPRLSQSLTGIMSTGEDGPIWSQIAEHGRAAAAFHAERFRTSQDRNFNPSKPAYSWLSLGSSWRGDQVRLVMTILPAEAGRRALVEHAHYKRALATHDWQAAAESVVKLGRTYPELDVHTSSDLDGIQDVVVHLCKSRDFRLANEAVAARFSATRLSQDPRFADMEARCRKHILEQIVARLYDQSAGREVNHLQISELQMVGLDAFVAARGCLRTVLARYEAASKRLKPPYSVRELRKRERRVRELGYTLGWWLGDAAIAEA